jgi:hypothetical protein
MERQTEETKDLKKLGQSCSVGCLSRNKNLYVDVSESADHLMVESRALRVLLKFRF